MTKTELEYEEESLGFSIKNITRSHFDLFVEIHFAIYDGVKPFHQIESEIDFIKQRLETGEWKITESYPESEEFTKDIFINLVELYNEKE